MNKDKQTIDHIDWKEISVLPAPANGGKQVGLAGAFAGIHNNVLMVAGGANFPDSMPWLGGKKKYYSDVYVFQKNSAGEVSPSSTIFQLPYPIAYGASCSTAKGIVCVGGENNNGLSNKVMLLQWDAANDSVVIKHLADLPFAAANVAITVKGSKVYVAGGEMHDEVSDRFLMLDVANDTAAWMELPRLPKPLSHAVMAIQSNGEEDGLYVIGGRKKNEGGISDLSSEVYRFHFNLGTWQYETPLPFALSAGTGLADSFNNIVLFGGDSGETFSKTEELIAAINSEQDPIKKEKLIQQKTDLQTNHPGFNKTIHLFNTLSQKWNTVGLLPFETQVTATAIEWGNQWIIPSGEIKAGVRTPRIIAGIPSYKKQ